MSITDDLITDFLTIKINDLEIIFSRIYFERNEMINEFVEFSKSIECYGIGFLSSYYTVELNVWQLH